MSLSIEATSLPGVMIIASHKIHDHRGSFSRLFCEESLRAVLGSRRVVQMNRSITCQAGTVRGLHFQHAPYAEMKLIRCLKGRVWDLAVNCQTLEWHAEELSEENNKMLIIPEGYAHGFQVLEPDSELLYLHTAMYHRESEGGFHPLDPALGIDWPLPVGELSQRDQNHPYIRKDTYAVPSLRQ